MNDEVNDEGEASVSASVPDSPSPPSSPAFSVPLSLPLSDADFKSGEEERNPSAQHQPPLSNALSSPTSNAKSKATSSSSSSTSKSKEVKKTKLDHPLREIIELASADFDEAKYASMSLLDVAHKIGITFPPPSWWPADEPSELDISRLDTSQNSTFLLIFLLLLLLLLLLLYYFFFT